MIYLASPYTHPDPIVMKTRYLLAQQVNAHFISQGFHVYSPIVHCHTMALTHTLPHDFDFWRRFNLDLIRRSDEFWVLTIPGYHESKGVAGELNFADHCGLPIKWVDADGNFVSGGTESENN